MEIEEIKKFRVDSHEFNTSEEAQEYIRSKTDKTCIFKKNIKTLEYYSTSLSFIPCIDDNDKSLRVFVKRYNNTDQGDGWEDILGREHLKYVDGLLQVIDSQRFIDKFIEQSQSYSIDAQDLGQLIVALNYHINMLEGANLVQVYKLVIDALARVQYSPIYIYE